MEVIGCRTRAAPHPDCARVVAAADLDAELPEADAVVLAAPLTAATRNLLDARRIGLLGPGAGVVNIGRGAVLDQDALCDALDAGRLGGAVLDVFAAEPVPEGASAVDDAQPGDDAARVVRRSRQLQPDQPRHLFRQSARLARGRDAAQPVRRRARVLSASMWTPLP